MNKKKMTKRNKKKDKGFTLVELLSVIVILAIITGIAILAFNRVQKNRELKEQEALETNLKIQGKKYYMETGETVFYVQDLIDYGLIVPDDETGSSYGLVNDVKRPPSEFSRELRIRGRINCTRIVVDPNNEKIEYDPTPHEKEDGSCEPKPTTDENLVIEMCSDDKCTTKTSFDPDKWYNSGIRLIVSTGGNTVVLDSNNTIWSEKKNLLKSIGKGNIHEFVASKSEVTDYVVTAYIGDDEINKETTVKFDVVKPVITVVSKPTIINGNLEIKITDDKSGIAGYYISKSSTPPTIYTNDCQSNPCMEKTIKQKVDSYGTTTYYVWAIDNAGNKSSGNPSVRPDDPIKIDVNIEHGIPGTPNIYAYIQSGSKYTGGWTKDTIYIKASPSAPNAIDDGTQTTEYRIGLCNDEKSYVTVESNGISGEVNLKTISSSVSNKNGDEYCIKACNIYGKCSGPAKKTIMVDKDAPVFNEAQHVETLSFYAFHCIGEKGSDGKSYRREPSCNNKKDSSGNYVKDSMGNYIVECSCGDWKDENDKSPSNEIKKELDKKLAQESKTELYKNAISVTCYSDSYKCKVNHEWENKLSESLYNYTEPLEVVYEDSLSGINPEKSHKKYYTPNYKESWFYLLDNNPSLAGKLNNALYTGFLNLKLYRMNKVNGNDNDYVCHPYVADPCVYLKTEEVCDMVGNCADGWSYAEIVSHK